MGLDCDFEARAETVDDLMRQCVEHARTGHGISEIPPALAVMVQSAIRDE